MDYVLIILVILAVVFLIIFFLAQDSKKESTKEKYGEAVGQLAYKTADMVSSAAIRITEPKEKKEKRLAKECLAEHNSALYRCQSYSGNILEKKLEVNDALRSSLGKLGLSEEKWKLLGRKLFYIGLIKKASRNSWNYLEKNTDYIRDDIINKWILNDDFLKWESYYLREALSFFGIDMNEWIKYGDAVVEMYNLEDDEDIKNYGVITSIKPMKNNLHLL